MPGQGCASPSPTPPVPSAALLRCVAMLEMLAMLSAVTWPVSLPSPRLANVPPRETQGPRGLFQPEPVNLVSRRFSRGAAALATRARCMERRRQGSSITILIRPRTAVRHAGTRMGLLQHLSAIAPT